MTGYLDIGDRCYTDESPSIELKIRYNTSKELVIPDNLDYSILQNINLEIVAEDIDMNATEVTAKRIAGWISDTNITIKRITLLIHLECCKNEEYLNEAKALAKDIKNSLAHLEVDIETVLSIE